MGWGRRNEWSSSAQLELKWRWNSSVTNEKLVLVSEWKLEVIELNNLVSMRMSHWMVFASCSVSEIDYDFVGNNIRKMNCLAAITKILQVGVYDCRIHWFLYWPHLRDNGKPANCRTVFICSGEMVRMLYIPLSLWSHGVQWSPWPAASHTHFDASDEKSKLAP